MSKVLPWVLLVWMAAAIWGAFLGVGAAVGFAGDSSRIVFFHVPTAWVATVAFLVSCVASVMYLVRRRPEDDERAAAAAGLGLLGAILATVTGSLFAKVEWGAYWNWDPRQTSITMLLLIYAAYLALRAAIADPERRATLAAAYAILAFVTVPFLVFVVPRVYWSLHPDVIASPEPSNRLDSAHLRVLLASLAGFTGLFAWLFLISTRVARLSRLRQEDVL